MFLQPLRCALFTSHFRAGFPLPLLSQHHQTQLSAGEHGDPGLAVRTSATNLAFQVYLPLQSPHLIQMPASKGISFLVPYPKLIKCAQIRELNL